MIFQEDYEAGASRVHVHDISEILIVRIQTGLICNASISTEIKSKSTQLRRQNNIYRANKYAEPKTTRLRKDYAVDIQVDQKKIKTNPSKVDEMTHTHSYYTKFFFIICCSLTYLSHKESMKF